MGPQELLTRGKILLVSVAKEYTYPKFHFETETDSLTDVQHKIKVVMF